MENIKKIGTIIILVAFLSASFSSVVALNYFPGVKAGQYVKFGNYAGQEEAFSSYDMPYYDWIVHEVVAVSGREVTIHTSDLEHYKNGTFVTNNDTAVLNVETGQIDGANLILPAILIPANLKEGDRIPPFDLGLAINKTETRTYLGVSRRVNIISYTLSTPEGTFSNVYVYDKESGVELEGLMDTGFFAALVGGGIEIADLHIKLSHVVIETNIFGGSASNPVFASGYFYVIAAIIVIGAVLAGVAWNKRRKKKSRFLFSPSAPSERITAG
jgi:hypothetical protein